MRSAAATASSTVVTAAPGETGMPKRANSCLPWYSKRSTPLLAVDVSPVRCRNDVSPTQCRCVLDASRCGPDVRVLGGRARPSTGGGEDEAGGPCVSRRLEPDTRRVRVQRRGPRVDRRADLPVADRALRRHRHRLAGRLRARLTLTAPRAL